MPAPTICESSTPDRALKRPHHPDGELDRLRRRVVDVDLAAILAEHGRRQIAERDPDLVVVEVDADRDAGGGVEPEQHRRAPRSALAVGAELLLDDKALVAQTGDKAADGRSREPGQAGQVAAACEPPAAKGVDDQHAVALAQGAHGAAGRH